MPPKPKYTKEEIVAAALGVVSEKGIDALTAKELGKALGMSTSPIFTVFDSMQQVQEAVRLAAMARFESYAHRAGGELPAFKQVGMQMILFAKEEPRLYQLIFMSQGSGATPFANHYASLGHMADEALRAIEADYGLCAEDAQALFEHVWIHTFGIGALCAMGAWSFSGEEISQMLTQDFTAMMMLLKGKKSNA